MYAHTDTYRLAAPQEAREHRDGDEGLAALPGMETGRAAAAGVGGGGGGGGERGGGAGEGEGVRGCDGGDEEKEQEREEHRGAGPAGCSCCPSSCWCGHRVAGCAVARGWEVRGVRL